MRVSKANIIQITTSIMVGSGLLITGMLPAQGAEDPRSNSYEEPRMLSTPVTPATSAFPIVLGEQPKESNDPADQPNYIPISAIQGETQADSSPLVGKTVQIKGWVTASYPEGNLNGFYIQQPGTGGEEKNGQRTASDAVFVYTSRTAPAEIGKCVSVEGKVAEYPQQPKPGQRSLTQITGDKQNPLKVQVLAEKDCGQPVTPVKLTQLPKVAEREAYEGMLVQLAGPYTVADLHSLNNYGNLLIAQGENKLLPQVTDVAKPGSDQAKKLEQANQDISILLDDGSSWNYMPGKKTNQKAVSTPLPYATQYRDLRVGSQLVFNRPLILTEDHGWVLHPQQQITGNTPKEQLPFTAQTNPPVLPEIPNNSCRGIYRVATFNVLNYFPDLGEQESDCTKDKAYLDREGNPITAKSCKVRGAYRAQDFIRQQTKIVKAINQINADVVALEEIENSTITGKDRDEALQQLVKALNQAAGKELWAAVSSPKAVPNNTDAIRTAFIYQPARIKPVGDSIILDDPAFTAIARSPLAQEFAPLNPAGNGQQFVVIVNHFKSKGSSKKPSDPADMDHQDGQGAYNGTRIKQAQALGKFAHSFVNKPVYLVGDFNAYSQEDPVQTLTKAGYQKLEMNGHSYVYSGRVGSLDHVFANSLAASLVTSKGVWEINAHEGLYKEYSRFNYNVTDFYEESPLRSSDHNPKLFGLNLVKCPANVDPGTKPNPNPGEAPKPTPGAGPNRGKGHNTTPLNPNSGQTNTDSSSAMSWVGTQLLSKTGQNTLFVLVIAIVLLTAGAGIIIWRRGYRQS